MKAPIETVRVSPQGRDQLIKLKRQTGIEHWNILCRWALCVSLREPSVPIHTVIPTDGGVEMSWRVFAGDHADVYSSFLKIRARKDGLGTNDEAIGLCLKLHLHRGLSYLASGNESRSIDVFLPRWLFPRYAERSQRPSF